MIWRTRDTFKRAMDKELREHKSSFIVFYILRALVIVSLVRQIILDNYEGAFFCILTIVLLYVPSWVQVRLRIELPPPLEITILCFIFAAEILGEVNAFYVNVPHWDTMLHTINGLRQDKSVRHLLPLHKHHSESAGPDLPVMVWPAPARRRPAGLQGHGSPPKNGGSTPRRR